MTKQEAITRAAIAEHYSVEVHKVSMELMSRELAALARKRDAGTLDDLDHRLLATLEGLGTRV